MCIALLRATPADYLNTLFIPNLGIEDKKIYSSRLSMWLPKFIGPTSLSLPPLVLTCMHPIRTAPRRCPTHDMAP
jgi:hypothetical protein